MTVFQNLWSAILVKQTMFFSTFKKTEDDRKEVSSFCKGNGCHTQVYIAHILKAEKP